MGMEYRADGAIHRMYNGVTDEFVEEKSTCAQSAHLGAVEPRRRSRFVCAVATLFLICPALLYTDIILHGPPLRLP